MDLSELNISETCKEIIFNEDGTYKTEHLPYVLTARTVDGWKAIRELEDNLPDEQLRAFLVTNPEYSAARVIPYAMLELSLKLLKNFHKKGN